MKEITVGRNGDQWFKIDNAVHDTVHNEHVRITVNDDGSWWLEDLKGARTNGTFIRDLDSEEWHPVQKCRITPTTMIRLSSYHSYTFMAHRVVQEPGSYTFELKAMLKLWHRLSADITAEEMRIAKRKKLLTGLMVGGAAVGIGGGALAGALAGAGIGGIGGLGSVFLYGRMLMAPDMQKLTNLKLKRQKLVTCPGCGRPMSENDVENLMCSICKCR